MAASISINLYAAATWSLYIAKDASNKRYKAAYCADIAVQQAEKLPKTVQTADHRIQNASNDSDDGAQQEVEAGGYGGKDERNGRNDRRRDQLRYLQDQVLKRLQKLRRAVCSADQTAA
jgi:hypothetical protein